MANAIVIYRGKPKPDSWARWLCARTMRMNSSNLVAITGRTGSGKTLSAISICEIMSKMDGVPFDVSHVVFSLRELMDLINSGKLKRGSKIVCDEFQCSISAREYQSKANKVFNYLLSTFRHRNLSLFFCTPFESLLDKNTRKLFHARFETMSINRKTQTCRLKPRYVEHVDFRNEPYRKQLIVRFKEDGVYKTKKVFFWDIPRPSKELEEAYEKKKLDFTNNLNKNISCDLKEFDESGKSVTAKRIERDWRKPLTEMQKKVMETLANIKETNRQETAGKILGVTMQAIGQFKRAAERKGYLLEEFKKNVEL